MIMNMIMIIVSVWLVVVWNGAFDFISVLRDRDSMIVPIVLFNSWRMEVELNVIFFFF